VQATAELRRTRLGFLCKDNGAGTRCYVLTRVRRIDERRQRTTKVAAARQLRVEVPE
jgi:hypothetical protein